jgi:hypothetical protein
METGGAGLFITRLSGISKRTKIAKQIFSEKFFKVVERIQTKVDKIQRFR